MASANKVILIGNVTRDPEVRYTPKGTAVTDVGLAVNRNFTVEGERREETTFVDVTVWGRQAEVVEQYVQKGKPLYIEGRLQLDTWEDKNSGEKRSRLRVVCENLQLLGGPPRDGGGGGAPSGGGDYSSAPAQSSSPAASAPSPAAPPAASEPPASSAPQEGPISLPGEDDDDIPF